MRKWLPLLAVSLSTFMLLVDLTIVSIAAPDLARELHSSFAALQWTVDLYVLVLAALLMAAGSLSDRLGHRRVFIAGLVVFAAASLACGVASGTGTLIAARGVQGIGAAAMYATNAALLGVVYTGRDRPLALRPARQSLGMYVSRPGQPIELRKRDLTRCRFVHGPRIA